MREMTGRALSNDVFLTGVRVPAAAVLGEVGGGWAVVQTAVTAERRSVGGAHARVGSAGHGGRPRPARRRLRRHGAAPAQRRQAGRSRRPRSPVRLACRRRSGAAPGRWRACTPRPRWPASPRRRRRRSRCGEHRQAVGRRDRPRRGRCRRPRPSARAATLHAYAPSRRRRRRGRDRARAQRPRRCRSSAASTSSSATSSPSASSACRNPRDDVEDRRPAPLQGCRPNGAAPGKENTMAKYLLLKHYRGGPAPSTRRADGPLDARRDRAPTSAT